MSGVDREGPVVPAATDEGSAKTVLQGRARQAYEKARGNYTAESNAEPADPVLVAAMESAVKRMPALERDVLLAHRLDNLTFDQIAERLGISSAEVLRIVASAIANLDRNLRDPRRHWWRLWMP